MKALLYVILVLDGIFLFISTFGNLLVILVMMREKHLRDSSTSIYIISLSLTDLLSNLIAVPYALAVVNLTEVFENKLKTDRPYRF